MSLKRNVVIGLVVIAGCLTGCGQPSDVPGDIATNSSTAQADGHSHDGWWCVEHGVPEEVCARCDPSLVAGFKAKQDWCEEHARPDSQCFIHHPEKEAEFAAQYEAKYGHKPPKPEPEAGSPAHQAGESKT